MSQVTTESECARLSVADLREWASEIRAEALDVWSNAETNRLRAQLESIEAELSARAKGGARKLNDSQMRCSNCGEEFDF